MFTHIKTLFSSKYRLFSYLLLVIFAGILWWSTTDIKIMAGNYGKVHTGIDIALSGITILFFPLFLVAFWYKSNKFGKKSVIDTKTGSGIIGGIIGTIISGASCCGATLAAYFGLLPLMSLLPWSGLEIKILGLIGLLFALSDIIQNLETCKTPKKIRKYHTHHKQR